MSLGSIAANLKFKKDFRIIDDTTALSVIDDFHAHKGLTHMRTCACLPVTAVTSGELLPEASVDRYARLYV